ncbi:MAG: hypothetical protein V5A39_12390 [Haloarculaceae archaeon]
MYGVVTRNEAELTWVEFERGCYEMKDVTGRAEEPVEDAVNMISCFGDNAAVEGNPDVASISADGKVATREQPYFDWSYVCPTHEEYRRGILEMVEDAAEANGSVRLDDVGFARPEYCHCDRCDERFEASEFDDRNAWRASVITEFVAEARERISGDMLLTLYPDPYPGHLYERSGIDVKALEAYVDEFVVPLYDMAYTTTYWLEIIASGFADLVSIPLSLELYAVEVDIDNLVHAMEVADAYASTVFLGYDASNARAAIRRMRADERDGESHGPGVEDT